MGCIGSLGTTGGHTASREGLEDLYRRNASDAYRLACLLTSDPAAAEEITQEAFVRIGRKVLPFSDHDHGRAYLFRTVVNLARGRGRRLTVERSALSKIEPAQAQGMPDVATQQDMAAALGTLPVRQRAALFLRYYLGCSEAEAAELLGCSSSALKSLVNRGLGSLRATLPGGEA